MFDNVKVLLSIDFMKLQTKTNMNLIENDMTDMAKSAVWQHCFACTNSSCLGKFLLLATNDLSEYNW